MSKDLEQEFERKFATWQVAQLRNLPKRARLDVLTKVVLQRLVKRFEGTNVDVQKRE
jgi:hypothetical protein